MGQAFQPAILPSESACSENIYVAEQMKNLARLSFCWPSNTDFSYGRLESLPHSYSHPSYFIYYVLGTAVNSQERVTITELAYSDLFQDLMRRSHHGIDDLHIFPGQILKIFFFNGAADHLVNLFRDDQIT